MIKNNIQDKSSLLLILFKMVFQALVRFLQRISIVFKLIILPLKVLVTSTKLALFNFDPILDAPKWITPSNYQIHLPAYRKQRAAHAESKLHQYFVIHVAVSVIFFLDSFVILAKYDFRYFHERMPELLTHQMYPEEYWQQGDMLMLA